MLLRSSFDMVELMECAGERCNVCRAIRQAARLSTSYRTPDPQLHIASSRFRFMHIDLLTSQEEAERADSVSAIPEERTTLQFHKLTRELWLAEATIGGILWRSRCLRVFKGVLHC